MQFHRLVYHIICFFNYTGWLRKHAIKFQTIEFLDGISGPAYGGESARHNDLHSLRQSKFLPALDRVQRVPPTAEGVQKEK